MKDDFENWNRNSSERFIFDMLVRRADTAVVDYWDQILEIIAANVDPDNKDYELRLDMLSLIEHLLQQPNLHSTIIFYTEIIIKLILLPSTEWRAGIPNVSIRKGAVICLMKLLEQKLIEKEKLQPMFKEIINKFKSLLDDEWANEIRFAALIFIKNLISYRQDDKPHEDYVDVYPQLLMRLDDAQDGIRIECCKALEVFFEKLPNPWSSSLYEYTIKAIMIHLDDPNPEV